MLSNLFLVYHVIRLQFEPEVDVELWGEGRHGGQGAGGQDDAAEVLLQVNERHGGVQAPKVGGHRKAGSVVVILGSERIPKLDAMRLG